MRDIIILLFGSGMGWLVALFILGSLILSTIRILNEYERGILFRLGRASSNIRGPGIVIVLPVIDRLVKVDLRIETMDVLPQDVITKDNISIKVNAVVYFKVVEPMSTVINVRDYLFATSQLAQTTLRAVLGQVELDELLSERDKINQQLQDILDKQTDPWGVKVTLVEVKHIDLPQEMQRAIAKQAEAERERRAKVIHAEGEFQAAQKLSQAAKVMSEHPISVQLRYLQTLTDIAAENNSTTVFPVPIDFMSAFTEFYRKGKS